MTIGTIAVLGFITAFAITHLLVAKMTTHLLSFSLYALLLYIYSKQERVTDPRQPSIEHVSLVYCIISARLTTHKQCVQCWMAEEKAERNHTVHGKALWPPRQDPHLAKAWPKEGPEG